jgi:hypothetical protein
MMMTSALMTVTVNVRISIPKLVELNTSKEPRVLVICGWQNRVSRALPYYVLYGGIRDGNKGSRLDDWIYRCYCYNYT